MLWLLPALLAPFIWAISNLIDSDLLSNQIHDPLALTLVTGIFASLPITLFLFLGIPSVPLMILGSAIFAGITGLLVYFPYLKALQTTHAANVILMWNLAPVFVLILSWLFLDEQLLPNEYLAAFVLIISSMIAGYERDQNTGHIGKAFYWILLASAMTSLDYLFLKYTLQYLTYLHSLPLISLGTLFMVIIIFICFKKSRQKLWQSFRERATRRILVLNEGIDLTASLIHTGALRLGAAGLVAAVSGLQPLFVLLLSPFFARRTKHHIHIPQIIFASILALLGFVLLY